MQDVGGKDERELRRVNGRTNESRDEFISEETYLADMLFPDSLRRS